MNGDAEGRCGTCLSLAASERTLKTLADSLASSPDRASPRYLDTKGTVEARARELERSRAAHEADAHYLDLLVMCSDLLALMP